jgi:HAE1 family hydrophobic/amphiphilic exporter-1
VAGYASTGLGGSVRNGLDPFSTASVALYERVNRLSAQQGMAPVAAPSLRSTPGGLVGGYGAALSNLFGSSYRTVQVGVSMDFTVHNRQAEANLAQSAIAERRLKLLRAQMEQTIAAEVRNAMQGIETARRRIATADASVRAAREKLESETRLFQTGESTNFLVLTRQNEYTDSRHCLLVANLDFNKAVARLEQATGTTLPANGVSLH